MSLIIWRPIMDEVDRAMFPFSAPEGWLSLGGWTGRDIYDQEPLYTLELVTGDGGAQEKPVRRAILWKFLSPDPEKRCRVEPAEVSEDNIADAAGHLGFKYFRSEPQSFGVWIIEEEP